MKVKSEHESGDCDLCDFSSGNLDSISLRFYGHSETIQDWKTYNPNCSTDLSQHLAARGYVLHCFPREANSLTPYITEE